MSFRGLGHAAGSDQMKKRPNRRMLRITMMVITMILTRLTTKSSKVRAKSAATRKKS